MESNLKEKIKLYFSRNLNRFHLADTITDTLHMLLMAVQSLPAADALEFIRNELKTRSNEKDHSAISSIANNPESVLIFSQLLAIPMFCDVRIVNFSNLYSWRKVTRIWLDHFLRFALVSFQYLGQDLEAPIDAPKYFSDPVVGDKTVNFQFLDVDLLDVLQWSYKLHLANDIFVFGHEGAMTVKEMVTDEDGISKEEVAIYDWKKSYARCCAERGQGLGRCKVV